MGHDEFQLVIKKENAAELRESLRRLSEFEARHAERVLDLKRLIPKMLIDGQPTKTAQAELGRLELELGHVPAVRSELEDLLRECEKREKEASIHVAAKALTAQLAAHVRQHHEVFAQLLKPVIAHLEEQRDLTARANALRTEASREGVEIAPVKTPSQLIWEAGGGEADAAPRAPYFAGVVIPRADMRGWLWREALPGAPAIAAVRATG